MKKMRKTNKKGFTLVELVIVIAVLAILAAIAIPTVATIIDNANRSAAETNAHQLQAAVSTYLAKESSGLLDDGAGMTLGDAMNDYGAKANDILKVKGNWKVYYNSTSHTAVASKDGSTDSQGTAITGYAQAVATNNIKATS